jgi:tRNA(adenine34) deaminase
MLESLFTSKEKEIYMSFALDEARKARNVDEVPIGAVIVQGRKVISSGYNLREITKDATTHAEMTAIRQANQVLGNWRIKDSAIFVTIEPCVMCSGALLQARVKEIYFGASNLKGGGAGGVLDVFNVPSFNHEAYVEGGILEEECAKMMSDFFRDKR